MDITPQTKEQREHVRRRNNAERSWRTRNPDATMTELLEWRRNYEQSYQLRQNESRDQTDLRREDERRRQSAEIMWLSRNPDASEADKQRYRQKYDQKHQKPNETQQQSDLERSQRRREQAAKRRLQGRNRDASEGENKYRWIQVEMERGQKADEQPDQELEPGPSRTQPQTSQQSVQGHELPGGQPLSRSVSELTGERSRDDIQDDPRFDIAVAMLSLRQERVAEPRRAQGHESPGGQPLDPAFAAAFASAKRREAERERAERDKHGRER